MPVQATTEPAPTAHEPILASAAELPAETVCSPATGDPAILGFPAFLLATTAVGLVLVGFVPPSAAGAVVPLIVFAALGQLLCMAWAAAQGNSGVAAVLGLFGGFPLTYAILLLGMQHNWLAIPADAVVRTQAVFLISWLVVIGGLMMFSLRFPLIFSLIFALFVLTLALQLAGTLLGSSSLITASGITIFTITALGMYVWAGSFNCALGGRRFPLGTPILRDREALVR